jgi:hypothetical protein
MKLFIATAFEKGQIPAAPSHHRPRFAGFRIAAEAVAEVLFTFPAYLGSPLYKIRTLVVFAQEQIVIPSPFRRRFPRRQRHAAMRAKHFLIVHFVCPPIYSTIT